MEQINVTSEVLRAEVVTLRAQLAEAVKHLRSLVEVSALDGALLEARELRAENTALREALDACYAALLDLSDDPHNDGKEWNEGGSVYEACKRAGAALAKGGE